MALASVKLEFITGPAVQAAQKLQRKTQDLSKAMSKFQRLSNRAWEKFAEKAKKTANVVQKNVVNSSNSLELNNKNYLKQEKFLLMPKKQVP